MLKILFKIFILPGTIITWFFYMFPSDGSYKTIRMSARWFRSTVMRFLISCFCWFMLFQEMSLYNLSTWQEFLYDTNFSSQSQNDQRLTADQQELNNLDSYPSNNSILEIEQKDIKSSSNSKLCLLLTDKHSLSDKNIILIVKELKNRRIICDGPNLIPLGEIRNPPSSP